MTKTPLDPSWEPRTRMMKQSAEWISKRPPFLVRMAPFFSGLVLVIVVFLATQVDVQVPRSVHVTISDCDPENGVLTVRAHGAPEWEGGGVVGAKVVLRFPEVGGQKKMLVHGALHSLEITKKKNDLIILTEGPFPEIGRRALLFVFDKREALSHLIWAKLSSQ